MSHTQKPFPAREHTPNFVSFLWHCLSNRYWDVYGTWYMGYNLI